MSVSEPGVPPPVRTGGRPRRHAAKRLAIFLPLGAVSLVMVVPLYLMLLMSLKTVDRVFAYPPDLWFTSLTFANFWEALFQLIPFPLYLRNTAVISFLVITGDLLSCSLVAYGFARYRFPGRDFLFMVLLSTMMVPFIVRLVPLFVLFTNLGWINTFLPLIVPPFFGTPLYIFLMRQFFLTIPGELLDAARIDGCSEIGIWWRIMLPLARPVLAAVAILSFQTTWNDFLGPLVFLQKNDVRTVILGLNGLMGMFVEWNLVMAAVVAVVLPMILIFFIFQRFFIKGIAVTGLKG
jgi:ABC-type glycerol-3-phosphate transport system permease component